MWCHTVIVKKVQHKKGFNVFFLSQMLHLSLFSNHMPVIPHSSLLHWLHLSLLPWNGKCDQVIKNEQKEKKKVGDDAQEWHEKEWRFIMKGWRVSNAIFMEDIAEVQLQWQWIKDIWNNKTNFVTFCLFLAYFNFGHQLYNSSRLIISVFLMWKFHWWKIRFMFKSLKWNQLSPMVNMSTMCLQFESIHHTAFHQQQVTQEQEISVTNNQSQILI